MKIAVIGAKGLPPKQGGIEHYCAEVYPRLALMGHHIDLYGRSSYLDVGWLADSTFDNVRVVSLPCLGIRGGDALMSAALGAVIASGLHYDVIHFHALGPSLFTWMPRLATSSRVIVTCQGLDWQRDKWHRMSSALIKLGEKMAVKYAHAIAVVSKDLQTYFSQTYNRTTAYIPNAPATYATSDPGFQFGRTIGLERDRYIVFLGRLVPEKKPDFLIDAFQRCGLQGWKLVFVGDSSDTTTYARKIQAQAVGNPNIVFVGELRGSYLAEIVRGAGLFVLPSSLEGLPLAMLEAMSEAIPVVASDIPPHQELIGNHRGTLFKANDLESCVHTIRWAVDHLHQIKVMSSQAQQYVRQHYSWDRIVNDYLALYSADATVGSRAMPDQLLQPGLWSRRNDG